MTKTSTNVMIHDVKFEMDLLVCYATLNALQPIRFEQLSSSEGLQVIDDKSSQLAIVMLPCICSTM